MLQNNNCLFILNFLFNYLFNLIFFVFPFLYQRAILIDPTQPDAWKRRGQIKQAKGLHKDAGQDFSRAIELGGDGETYVQRANVYYQSRHFKLALVDLIEVTRRGGGTEDKTINMAVVYNQLGMVHAQLGNISESIQSYETALSINPKCVF